MWCFCEISSVFCTQSFELVGRMASLYWAHGLDILGAWPRYIGRMVLLYWAHGLAISHVQASDRDVWILCGSTGFFAEISRVFGYLQSLIALSFCSIISTVSPLVMNSTRLPVKSRRNQVTRTHMNSHELTPTHTNSCQLIPNCALLLTYRVDRALSGKYRARLQHTYTLRGTLLLTFRVYRAV